MRGPLSAHRMTRFRLPSISLISSSYLQSSISCDIRHTSEHRRHVLRVTSLWLGVPICIAIQDSFHEYEKLQILLLGWTIVTCTISTVRYPSLHTIWGPTMTLLDRMCARLQFAFLYIFFAFGVSVQSHSVHFVTTFPIAILFCFSLSQHSNTLHSNTVCFASVSHLSFRFFGYWWTFFALTSCNVTAEDVLFNSNLYWGHILYTLVRTGYKQEFRCHTFEYVRGCFEIIALEACVVYFGLQC